jgi:hypothetical protein
MWLNILSIIMRLSSLLTWNHKATIKKFLTSSFCKTAKSEFNHLDAKILSYNVQDAKIMATCTYCIKPFNCVKCSGPHDTQSCRLNVSFAAEAILLIIKAAPYIVI